MFYCEFHNFLVPKIISSSFIFVVATVPYHRVVMLSETVSLGNLFPQYGVVMCCQRFWSVKYDDSYHAASDSSAIMSEKQTQKT